MDTEEMKTPDPAHLAYLDKLLESSTDKVDPIMLIVADEAVVEQLEDLFGLSKRRAKEIVIQWMELRAKPKTTIPQSH